MNTLLQVKVGDVEMSARFEEFYNRHHQMFKIKFENGYENVFYTDVESGRWMEEDLGFTMLAMTIGKEITSFLRQPIHVPKILTWHKKETDDRTYVFGFFQFRKGQHKMYEIYNSNRKYMYTLVEMDTEDWQIMGNQSFDVRKVDSDFVQHVISVLPLYNYS
ncbi:MAG: hypothetical protein ABIT96_10810 [Ferruginibacter sp.]